MEKPFQVFPCTEKSFPCFFFVPQQILNLLLMFRFVKLMVSKFRQ